MEEITPPMIYAGQMRQACVRLKAALRLANAYETDRTDIPSIDGAVLQIRKALELIAFAAIAPDLEAFAELRARGDVDEAGDYTRDYHARKILNTLKSVNPDFYPLPLTGPVRQPTGELEFGRKEAGYLTRGRFCRQYDGLAKYLHAENPWGTSASLHHLAKRIPALVEEIYQLIDLHGRIVRAPDFYGVWVVRMDRDGGLPQLMTAIGDGDFVDRLRESAATGGDNEEPV